MAYRALCAGDPRLAHSRRGTSPRTYERVFLATLGVLLSACVNGDRSSSCLANSWQYAHYQAPLTDQQLERYIGEVILVTFRWDGPSSILHSTMVVGELREYDSQMLRLATADGRDGACMPDGYWNLLVEHGRVSVDADHPGEILVRRLLVDSIIRTEERECRQHGGGVL